MYPKTLSTLTGLCLLFLTACTATAHLEGNTNSLCTDVRINSVPATKIKKVPFTGPPEYIPEIPAGNKKPAASSIIEKGGHYVFIPPAYTMARPEKGSDKYAAAILQQKVRKIKKFD